MSAEVDGEPFCDSFELLTLIAVADEHQLGIGEVGATKRPNEDIQALLLRQSPDRDEPRRPLSPVTTHPVECLEHLAVHPGRHDVTIQLRVGTLLHQVEHEG